MPRARSAFRFPNRSRGGPGPGVVDTGRDSFNEIPFQSVQVRVGDGIAESPLQRAADETLFPTGGLTAQVDAPAVGASGGIGPHFVVRRAHQPDQIAFRSLVTAGDTTAFRDVALFRNYGYLR